MKPVLGTKCLGVNEVNRDFVCLLLSIDLFKRDESLHDRSYLSTMHCIISEVKLKDR